MDSSGGSGSTGAEGKSSPSAGGGYATSGDPSAPGNDVDVSPNAGMTSSGSTGGGMGGGTTPSGSGEDTSLGQPGEGQGQG